MSTGGSWIGGRSHPGYRLLLVRDGRRGAQPRVFTLLACAERVLVVRAVSA